jgi:hypothetical protein
MSSAVLPLTAQLVRDDAARSILEIGKLACRLTVISSPDGVQHVLLARGACRLQLAVTGVSVFERVRVLTEAIVAPPLLERRYRALRQLAAAVRTGDLNSRFHLADPRSHRFSLILQAIDGAMATASQREIAVALFGRRRVEVDWSDPADHVRDRVRRAIRRGRSLISSVYLDLLS